MGIATGGWVPFGCVTEEGPNPALAAQFGLKEMESDKYPPRTEANVRDSDGTMRFAANFNTAGERCTLKALKWFDKPYFDVDVKKPPTIEGAVTWIVNNKVKVLNIAGNRESTNPGIGSFVEQYLACVFAYLIPVERMQKMCVERLGQSPPLPKPLCLMRRAMQ
jgi:hypothetical protein